MSKNYNNLRKKHHSFYYDKYAYSVKDNMLEITFNFRIHPDISFSPTLVLPISEFYFEQSKETLENLVLHIGLVEMLSYWKATCAKDIHINAGYLSEDQVSWWYEIILNGMGEYFYTNSIDFTEKNFINIIVSGKKPHGQVSINLKQSNSRNRILIPFGGGKDSFVTFDLLRRHSIGLFSINPNKYVSEALSAIATEHQILTSTRKIDSKILELNNQGYLNGHTPFTAYSSFVSLFVAVLNGFDTIAYSNEKSASDGNLLYHGRNINHQWSKSFHFEKMFREYIKAWNAPEYFSFLRPVNELQIVKIFSEMKKHHSLFSSCNDPQKIKPGKHKWCCNCAKCLFVYICMYPFVSKSEIVNIFGKDLFEDNSLYPLLLSLAGKQSKPFECVGTKDESLAALFLGHQKASREDTLPVLLRKYQKDVLKNKADYYRKLANKLLSEFSREHFVPPKFENILKLVAIGQR